MPSIPGALIMKTIKLDAPLMQAIAGHLDEVIRLIEYRFGVRLSARGDEIRVSAEGDTAEIQVDRVVALLDDLAQLQADGVPLSREDLKTAVGLKAREPELQLLDHFRESRIELAGKKGVLAKSPNQRRYIESMRGHDLVFGIGPAGTGKTYLAVAMAVAMLSRKRVRRIILARPAVEAGERLGFLPGDVTAKVDPYLRPLYDALYDLLEPDVTERFLEQGTIEVAPLAFMRGRTLDHSFMILDEAQNTTSEQMKMFLTRIGFHSKAVVTGDVTQIDLPSPTNSGLVMAEEVVGGIDGIDFVHFDEKDVVRHPLVQSIILAYDRHRARRDARGDLQSAGTRGEGRS